jgi:hypothetical protein
MRIINTNKNFRCRIFILIFAFCILNFYGCAKKDELTKGRNYARQSQVYYERAIAKYKNLIKQAKDQDKLFLALGQLYYSHGDFAAAVEALKKTPDIQAKKFLAISYYHLGDFTDALEVFRNNEILDDEYQYYYGLTCEKLNLFDQALNMYKKITTKEFHSLALTRINIIDKQVTLAHIKDISPQINKILAEAPSQDQYPQAGALILYCDEKVKITPENTQITYLHYVIKILNERGKEDFSETEIGYDSTDEKVELEYARVIKPDGTIVEVGSRHIRDVSKYLNFPLYSNARAYIISFPEITEGASIEYKLKVYSSQLINKKDFVLSYPVQASEPIIRANFTLDLPQEKVLFIKILNEKYNDFGADLKPVIQKENNRIIYHWQFKNIPQIIPEPGMPSAAEINPTMLISSFNQWKDIYNWWWNLAKEKIKADTSIKDKVKELTQGLSDEEAKIQAVYNFCAQKIRYVAVEYGEAGYEPHYAGDIFKNKYGDCKDQAILLVTMLKEAGISAWPVLIGTKETYNLNADFPAVFFNHCITALSLQDKIIFLDPTAETCAFSDLPAGDQDRKVLLFKEDGYQILNTPLYPAEHNLLKNYLKIKMKRDESIAAEKSIFTYGVYDQAQRFWLLYTQPELIEEALKGAIQGISIGAKLESYTIKNLKDLNTPMVLSYTFNGPEYFTAAGNLRILPQLTGVDTSLVAKDKRKYPIESSTLDMKETILEIELPSNFVIKYMPDSVSEENAWFKFIAEYKRKGNRIYFRQNTEFKGKNIFESQYPDFKACLEELAKKTKQRIVLEKIR